MQKVLVTHNNKFLCTWGIYRWERETSTVFKHSKDQLSAEKGCWLFVFNVLILQCSSLFYFRVLFSNLDLDDSYSLERRVRNAPLENTELELPALRYFAHPLGKQHSRAAAGRGLESMCLSWASELLLRALKKTAGVNQTPEKWLKKHQAEMWV